jgi:hypothetical protein
MVRAVAWSPDGFAAGKELAALDEHQVPQLGLLAPLDHLGPARLRLLSVLAATQPGNGHRRDDRLIPLTRNEIRRLFTGLSQQLPAPALQLHWSRWRRRHQATARACHYRRRARTPACQITGGS